MFFNDKKQTSREGAPRYLIDRERQYRFIGGMSAERTEHPGPSFICLSDVLS